MTAREAFVPTGAIQHAVVGRENGILAALGICWTGRSQHINCPYPDHADNHPSWRWDATKRRAFCTCTKPGSIFDVVCKMKEVSFEAAKIIVAEMIGRADLIRRTRGKGGRGGGSPRIMTQRRNTWLAARSPLMPQPSTSASKP